MMLIKVIARYGPDGMATVPQMLAIARETADEISVPFNDAELANEIYTALADEVLQYAAQAEAREAVSRRKKWEVN